MFGCQRLGIGEGFEMNDSPIHIVLVQWVVGFVLCRRWNAEHVSDCR
jgi:hypothetical protein